MRRNLKRLRENYGISRSLLSRITGIPYRTIQNWELGTRQMTDYEYEGISYRLSEREALLKLIMSRPIPVAEEYCGARWFSDKNGYGYIADIFGVKHKVYSHIEVRYNAVQIVPIWAQWTIEDLIEEENWKRVISFENL